MQKKLIALAIAGLASSAAFAQSNVTVYGLIDMSYEHASSGSTKLSGINAGALAGSRLGFKGEEALGNGMKAIFDLEYGSLKADTNAGLAGSRQSWVGLTGNFGTVTAGRVYNPASVMAQKYDTLGGANSFSSVQGFANYTFKNGNSALGEGASSNTVQYTSNVMSGFTVAASYGFNDVTGADSVAYTGNPQRTFSFSVDYSMGPLALAYAYQRSNDVTTVNQDAKENIFGAMYDFGVVSLQGLYSTEKETGIGGVAAARTDYRTESIGLNVPVTKIDAFHIAYTRLNDRLVTNDDSKGWGMYFDHDMSKRTKLYVGYNRTSNDSGATRSTPAATGNTTAGFGVVAAGRSSNGYSLGMLHSF